MSKHGAAPHVIGAIIGALVLIAAMPASAQQTGNGERGTNGNSVSRDQANGSVARKPAKAAPAKISSAKTLGAADKPKPREATRDPWTIDDALINPRSKALTTEPRVPAKPQFGRIQLDTGSIGFETEAKVKENQFSDGRVVPGLETVKRAPPSYFGLSLSLPTHNNSMLPVPINPWEPKN